MTQRSPLTFRKMITCFRVQINQIKLLRKSPINVQAVPYTNDGMNTWMYQFLEHDIHT